MLMPSLILAQSPELLAPEDSAQDVSISPELQWSEVAGAASYDIEVSNDEAFNQIYREKTGITDTQYDLKAGLVYSGQFYWRVRSRDQSGDAGQWSDTSVFTVVSYPDPPSLVSPKKQATGESLTPTFEWSEEKGVESYDLQIALDEDFDEVQFEATKLTTTKFKPEDSLDYGQKYYWRVLIRIYARGTAGASETRTFETVEDNPSSVGESNPVEWHVQNVPNPFSGTTQIRYSLPKSTHVTVTIYDGQGRQVAVLADEKQKQGEHMINFDGGNHGSGILFYRLRAGDYQETKKMMIKDF